MMTSAECGECFECHGVLCYVITCIERCQLEKHFVQKDDLSAGFVAHIVVVGYISEDNF